MNDIKSTFANLTKPLLLDGAMGSILQSSEDYIDTPLWTTLINIKNPEAVIDLHKQYIKAGADIITANTFRTNPVTIEIHGAELTSKRLVNEAVNLAYKSVGNNEGIFVAGSNPPAEDCYKIQRTISQNELNRNHYEHIDYLMMSGVDFILNETFSHFDEIKIVSEFCSQNDIPFVMSLFVDNNLNILSGKPLTEVINFVKGYNPLAILVNCVFPDIYKKLFMKNIDVDGFYLNCGSGEHTDKEIECGIDAESYSEIIKPFLYPGLKIVGSCCGSSPNHTKMLRKAIDELY